jgi:multidrug efflux pump subunit AcrA (membrane-fusion protein)
MRAKIIRPERIIVVVAACLPLLLNGCTGKGDNQSAGSQAHGRASVSEEGKTIVFPEGSPGLVELATAVANRKTAVVSVIAPARVVASIAPMMTAEKEPIVLFESPDITSLYSQYRQGKTNVERTSKNLARTRDMFENHAATGKDVTDAETDAANARASLAEFEGKLRAGGFNPVELAVAKPGTVWLIADVTESQLPDVDKGEDVDIFFSSFPGRKVVGKAEAVGEVVDPVTRTIKVRVSAPNHQGKLLPGMFARVDFGDPVPDVFVLPPGAIATVEGKDFIFIEVAPREYRRRQVVIRYSSADQVVLSTGIQDGEHIVTSGTMLLKGLSFGY